MGRTKRVRLDTSNPLHSPLAELMIRSFGPVVVIGEEFEALDNVTQVSIYGSWAARYSGEQGPTPNDIDVLVLGRPDRDEIYEAARRSERRLGVAVNTTIRTPEDWSRAEDSFTRQVKTSPMVTARPREEVG
ncbi:nucleotidyltransferase domain-containing protein [Phytoactinopolyspora endophytica]|uniref:nucleotidyltransferase domain-containing protein n=1 Tax=Phytoactinopolyspora endophytica TaxID=1642495 RepID=UPI00101C227D|nr:nucleotidyltransferase domain-containing protein [Phytoactinopolyspora endophytica]